MNRGSKARLLKSLIVAAIFLVIIVIALGAWTRLTDAGLGCPDWPGCYGHLDVRDAIAHVETQRASGSKDLRESFKTIPEMVHRYAAGTLGLFILLINILMWFGKAKKGRKHALILLALVIGQAILGMLTVTMGLHPAIVMLHLLGGFSTLVLLSLLLVRIFSWPRFEQQTNKAKKLISLSLGILIIQIMLGGWTSANYAAVVCTDFPICQGDWQNLLTPDAFQFWNLQEKLDNKPDYEFGVFDYRERVTMHVSHRIGAIVTFIMLLYTLLYLRKRYSETGRYTLYQRLASLSILLLFVQVGLGIANIWFKLPIAVAVAHNNIAAALLVFISMLCYINWLPKTKA
jgi:cytochrome c oxidase assembly protein subunit 15